MWHKDSQYFIGIVPARSRDAEDNLFNYIRLLGTNNARQTVHSAGTRFDACSPKSAYRRLLHTLTHRDSNRSNQKHCQPRSAAVNLDVFEIAVSDNNPDKSASSTPAFFSRVLVSLFLPSLRSCELC